MRARRVPDRLIVRLCGLHGTSVVVLSLMLPAYVVTAGVAMAAQARTVGVSGPAAVIDGDTLEVAGERIRLFGIDAPESSQTCSAFGTSYPCGTMATAWLVRNTLGFDVDCKSRARDRWDRLVAICSVNGSDLGLRMVEAGWALAFRRYSERYIPAEEAASRQGAGLWQGPFVTPWQWRRGDRDLKAKPISVR